MKSWKFLFIAVIIAACTERKKPPEVVVTPPVKDTTVTVCDFGIDPLAFNTVQRELPPEEVAARGRGRKVKDPPAPPPPTPPVVVNPPIVILLDFDGHTVSGTTWNYSGSIVATPSGMVIDEQQRVLDTAASRFAGFNIRFTADEAVFNAATIGRRLRCILTEHYTWFGMAGGVSFVGSAKWADNTPCFVFTILLNYNTKMITEATIHEIGHTINLYHQSLYENGVKVSDYHSGIGNEAPCMGVGYYKPYVRWWNGTNSYGNPQNDTIIMRDFLR